MPDENCYSDSQIIIKIDKAYLKTFVILQSSYFVPICTSGCVYLTVYCKQAKIGQNEVAILEESQVDQNQDEYQLANGGI